MPRTSATAVQEEAKYPEEVRRSDKDDRKQQSQERKKSTKAPADKLVELQQKFESTDYSANSGMTPEQRMAAMSHDVNAIVHERVEREKAIEQEESAAWWAKERAGEHSTEPKQSAAPIAAKVEAKPTQKVGVEKDEVIAKDVKTQVKATRSAASRPEKEDIGRSSGDSNDELTDQLVEVSRRSQDSSPSKPVFFRARGSKLDEPAAKEIPNALEVGPTLPAVDGVNAYLQQTGTNHRSSWKSTVMSPEQASLDKTLAERREYLAMMGPAADDPDNHPAASDSGRPEFKLTSSVPHGSVSRQEQRSSTAHNITGAVTENDDPTRTHTRPGVDRKLELEKKPGEKQPNEKLQSALKGTEDSHSGAFFATRKQSDRDHDAAAQAWTQGQMRTRLSVPSTLPPGQPEQTVVTTTRTEAVSHPGFVAELKHVVSDAKDSVVHALDVTKDKILDAGHSVQSSLHLAKDKAEVAIDRAEDKLVAAKDRVEDAAEGAWDSTKGAVVAAKDKIVHAERRVEKSADRAWDATKGKAKEVKQSTERGLERSADRVESDWERVKDRVADDWESVKERVESDWERTKDMVGEGSRKAERTIVDSKEDLTYKLRGARSEIRSDIGEMQRQINMREEALKREAQRVDRDVRKAADEAKLKAERGWERTKERADEIKYDAKSKAGELKRGAERETHSLAETASAALHRTEDDAKSLLHKARDGLHWLNPLNHIGNGDKDQAVRELDVDSSPEGVTLTPASAVRDHASHSHATERLPRHATPNTFTEPAQPVHVPNSLRGLESSEPLPPAKLPSMKLPSLKLAPSSVAKPESQGIYVPNSLRGLEDSEPLPKSEGLTLRVPKLGMKKGDAVPVHVPNSLRGLESSEIAPKKDTLIVDRILPQENLQPLPHPNAMRSDNIEPISLPTREPGAGRGGFFSSLTHFFRRGDSPSSADLNRPEWASQSDLLSRQEKLNASARDFWDLKAQEGHPVTPASPLSRDSSPIARSVTPVSSPRSLSVSPRSPVLSVSSPEMTRSGMHGWGVMRDPLFEELLPQVME